MSEETKMRGARAHKEGFLDAGARRRLEAMLREGEHSQATIAKRFGVSVRTVNTIAMEIGVRFFHGGNGGVRTR